MNKNILIISFLVLVLINTACTTTVKQEPGSSENNNDAIAVREFTVRGSNFKYDMQEIKVKKGEGVIINFVSDDGNHDFTIDEFNARTKIIAKGEKDTIDFIADKSGTFEFYCSVGQHRALGMKGSFIVEP